jgi:hypothetical protein
MCVFFFVFFFFFMGAREGPLRGAFIVVVV